VKLENFLQCVRINRQKHRWQ